MMVPALPFRAAWRLWMSVMMPVPPWRANLMAASTLGSIEPALK